MLPPRFFRSVPSFTTILLAIIPVFLVMIAGAGFQRAGWLSEELETGMMRLVLNLLAPCLIFTKITGNPALASVSVAGWSIGTGLVLILRKARIQPLWLGSWSDCARRERRRRDAVSLA